MKGHKSSPRPVPKPATPGGADARPPEGSLAAAALTPPVDCRLLAQAAATLTASVLLGFGFNSANPLGIRFSAGRAGENQRTDATTANAGAALAAASRVVAPVLPVVAAEGSVRSGTGTGTSSVVESGSPSPVDWPEVKRRLAAGEIVLLDARAKPYYLSGHIPGAQLLSIFGSSAEVDAFRAQYPTHTPLVVYCGSSSCPLSKEMAERLVREYGFSKVQYMTSGFLEWQRDEGPPQAPDRPSLNPLPTKWAEVEPVVPGGQTVLVDARPVAEFDRGHLPGAVSLPDNVSPDALAAFISRVPKDRRIVLYGEAAGARGPFLLGSRLMQDHGYLKVNFLTEGYREWSRGTARSTP